MVDTAQSLERIIQPAGVDTEKPATNQNNFRLYNHTLCPFSARARYTMACKGIEFQSCEVDLDQKAQWHVDFNGGSAPVLETTAGKLVPESGIIQQWALEQNPNGGIQLIPSDPLEAAKMRVRMDKFGKTLPGLFPTILSRG